MPCEKCNVKFGIITRKKSCYECHRLFCRNCLAKREERFLCPNCTILTKRPLSRIDLAQLKVKDLIFYLQSKHISTSGCVEKDDLINLVIAHVNSGGSSPRTPGSFSGTSSNTESASGGSSRYGSFYRNGTKNCTNTFDQIKHTCQNLFSTFSEKINGGKGMVWEAFSHPALAYDFLCLFVDAPEVGRPRTGFATQEEQQHIFTQPRFGSNNVYHSVDPSVRPTNDATSYRTTNLSPSNDHGHQRAEPMERPQNFSSASSGMTGGADSSAVSSSFSTPSRDACSPLPDERQPSTAGEGQTQALLDDRIENILALEPGDMGCDCCTDEEDEERNVPAGGVKSKSGMPSRSKQASRSFSHSNLLSPERAGSSVDTSVATPPKVVTGSHTPSSSFDDLLADGEGSSSNADHAIAQDTLAATSETTEALVTTVASTDDTDQWQIVNTLDSTIGEGADRGAAIGEGESLEAATHSELPLLTDVTNETTTVTTNEAEESSDSISHSVESKPNALPAVPGPDPPTSIGSTTSAMKRCRSDSYLLADGHAASQQRSVGTGTLVLPDPPNPKGTLSSDPIPSSSHPASNSSATNGMCIRCGKRRNGIRRKLKKFRKQLEATTVSEAEKRRKLEAFLGYLERRSKGSFDLTDSESITEEASVSLSEGAAGEAAAAPSTATGAEGHVARAAYPKPPDDLPICTNLYSSGNQELVNMKQINLSDIKESADLDVLSVKQLKRILTLNRVDFKGCCEKAELKERVLRLWRDYKSIPSIEKLPSDNLCKVCMDAPIECVVLECGHMATCTACGKVLSECPICRQYIVRVVRFFRA
uniref:RING-type domain-containing protein n=1 Tax=Anopheles epiroticus TaxID=199890 RepID=A0A182PHV1_9DIPT